MERFIIDLLYGKRPEEALATRSAATATPWMSSLSGTARSRDYRSAEPLSFAIACTWSLESWHPEPSIYAWVPCGGSPMKPVIAVFSVLISPPVSGA